MVSKTQQRQQLDMSKGAPCRLSQCSLQGMIPCAQCTTTVNKGASTLSLLIQLLWECILPVIAEGTPGHSLVATALVTLWPRDDPDTIANVYYTDRLYTLALLRHANLVKLE